MHIALLDADRQFRGNILPHIAFDQAAQDFLLPRGERAETLAQFAFFYVPRVTSRRNLQRALN